MMNQLKKITELKSVINDYEVHLPEYIEPLLEYVSIWAEKYRPTTDEDGNNGYWFPRPIGDFAWRYLNNEIDKSKEKKYLKDDNIQDTLKAFGYDVEKFWYLLLFVNDYSYGACLNGIKINDTPAKQIRKLIDGIIEYAESVNDTGITFKKPVKIILDRAGKHKITVDNSIAISWLTKICIQELEKIDDVSAMTISITQGTGKIERYSVSNSQHIWYFAKMFLNFFELVNPQEEFNENQRLIFISKLIYIVGLTKDTEYLDSLKGIKHCYQDKDLGVVNGIYL